MTDLLKNAQPKRPFRKTLRHNPIHTGDIMKDLNTTKFTDEQLIKEIMWENHQVEEGVRRYKDSLESKSFDDTDQGTKIMRTTIELSLIHI